MRRMPNLRDNTSSHIAQTWKTRKHKDATSNKTLLFLTHAHVNVVNNIPHLSWPYESYKGHRSQMWTTLCDRVHCIPWKKKTTQHKEAKSSNNYSFLAMHTTPRKNSVSTYEKRQDKYDESTHPSSCTQLSRTLQKHPSMPRKHVRFEESHTNTIDRTQGSQICLVTLLTLPHVTHGAVKKSAADRGEIGWEGVYRGCRCGM